MSKLYYDITITEAVLDNDDNIVSEIEIDLPHHNQIKDWLPKEWDSCEIHKTFDGIAKDKIVSTKMTISKRKQDNNTYKTVARVTVTFQPGLRLNEKLRHETFDQLDAQMVDGFGESYDMHRIPGVEEKYRIQF